MQGQRKGTPCVGCVQACAVLRASACVLPVWYCGRVPVYCLWYCGQVPVYCLCGTAGECLCTACVVPYALQVSASPKLHDECLKAAKFLARLLESLVGADVKFVQTKDNKNPVVVGRLGHRPDRPTVTFYGHYDVQPAMESDWQVRDRGGRVAGWAKRDRGGGLCCALCRYSRWSEAANAGVKRRGGGGGQGQGQEQAGLA